MQDKQQNNGVKLKWRALGGESKRKILENPALRYPVGHERSDAQCRRNRCAFKVLGLAGLILGKDGDGNVESGQPRQAAKDEER